MRFCTASANKIRSRIVFGLVGLFIGYRLALAAGLDPAAFVIRFEDPSGNPTAQNPTSTASGLYQMLNGTWATYAQDVPGASAWTTAGSAPPSVQTAVFYDMFAKRGFSDYTCPNCDPPLAAALAKDGGISAFGAQGSYSTNPLTYTALDGVGNVTQPQSQLSTIPGSPLSTGAANDPSAYDAGSTTQTPVTLGDGSILAAPSGTTAATPVEAPTFRAFTWVWNQWQSTIQQPLVNDIQVINNQAFGAYTGLVPLVIALTALGMMYHLQTPTDLTRKVFKLMFVGGFVGASGLYTPYFVPLVHSLPAWFGQGFGPSNGNAGPAAGFDNVITSLLVTYQLAFKASTGWLETAAVFAFVLVSAPFVIIPDLVMFCIWFASQVITELLTLIGGSLSLTLLSAHTEQIFWKYIHSLIGLAVVAVIAVILSVMALQLMQGVFAAIPQASTAAAIAANTVEAAVAITAVAMILAIFWVTIERITGHAGTAQLATTPQRSANRAVSTVTGPVTNNVVQFTRRSSAVGRAVSTTRRGP